MTFDAVVWAAVIAGIVSLGVPLINNGFTRKSREDEHKRRRQDWFLEKQSRDAEEIIASLDSFLKTSAKILSLARMQVLTSQSLESLDESSESFESKVTQGDKIDGSNSETKMTLDEDDLEAVEASVEDAINELYTLEREFNEGMDSVNKHIASLETGFTLKESFYKTVSLQNAWFTYDAIRLTIWFDNSTEQRRNLEDLRKQFNEVYDILMEVANESHVVATESDLDSVRTKFVIVENRWKQLVQHTADTQQSLVKKLREV